MSLSNPHSHIKIGDIETRGAVRCQKIVYPSGDEAGDPQWVSYTPAVTSVGAADPVIDAGGSITGTYSVSAKVMKLKFILNSPGVGTAGSAGSDYRISLPAGFTYADFPDQALGAAYADANSTINVGVVAAAGADLLKVYVQGTGFLGNDTGFEPFANASHLLTFTATLQLA